MKIEFSLEIGPGKSERSYERNGYRAGYRARRFDTRMGTMYLVVPKPRKGDIYPSSQQRRKGQKQHLSMQSKKPEDRCLERTRLVVSAANKGLVAAVPKAFAGASSERRKVHFMINMPAHIPTKQKNMKKNKMPHDL